MVRACTKFCVAFCTTLKFFHYVSIASVSVVPPQMFQKYRINYALVLKANPRTLLKPSEILDASMLMTVVLLLSFTVFSFAASSEAQADVQRYTMLGTTVFFFVLAAWPGKHFYGRTRWYLAKLLWRTVTSPFSKVQFKEGFFADQLTSMVRLVMDLSYTVCYYTTAAFLLDTNEGAKVCQPFT